MSSPRLNLDFNKRDFFAQKGTMILTDRASLANLEELTSSPMLTDRSPYQSPRNRQPTMIQNSGSPRNNGGYPPTFMKPEAAGFGFYQEPAFTPQMPIATKQPIRYEPIYPGDFVVRSSPHSLTKASSNPYSSGPMIKPFQANMYPPAGYGYVNSLPNMGYDYQLRQPTFVSPKNNLRVDIEKKIDQQHKMLERLMTNFDQKYNNQNSLAQLKYEADLKALEMKYVDKQGDLRRKDDKKKTYAVLDLHLQSPNKKYNLPDIHKHGSRRNSKAQDEGYHPQRGGKRQGSYQQNQGNYYPRDRDDVMDDDEPSPYFESVRKPKHQVYKSVNMQDSRGFATERGAPKPRTFVESQNSIDDRTEYRRQSKRTPSLQFQIQMDRREIPVVERREALKLVRGEAVSVPVVKDVPLTKAERKKKAQLRVKVTSWSLLYSLLLYNEVKKKVMVEREGFLKNISQNISTMYHLLETYITQTAGAQIQKMFLEKGTKFVFITKKPLPEKTLEAECSALLDYFKSIVTLLAVNTRSLSTYFFTLVATLSEEGSLVPNDYFTEFELKRQQFSYFGKLKFITPERSKFIIGGLILRVFVQKVLMRPWESLKIEIKKFNHEKILFIGSIMYNIMMEVLEKITPIFDDNQGFIPTELKVRPKRNIAQATAAESEKVPFPAMADRARDGEIVEGFYARHQLVCFFGDRIKAIDEIKVWILEWFDRIYENSHKEMIKALENQQEMITN